MKGGIHSLANRAFLWQKGSLAVLTDLESREFTPVHPAAIFPRMGQFNLGGASAVQHSQTTCGTAVLGVANALFDPALLESLQHKDPSLSGPERRHLAVREFTALQHHLLGQVTGRTWPRALGTPPWGMAKHLRVPGIEYDHMPIDDTNTALAEVITGLFQRALGAGIPVPLYVGGSLQGKVSSAAPRHVVLLVPPPAIAGHVDLRHARIYEPGRGRVYRRGWEQLWNRSQPDVAFGGWSNVTWVLVPKSLA